MLLIRKCEPHLEADVRIMVDFPVGFLGPSLGKTLGELREKRVLPDKPYSIVEVSLTAESSLTGEKIVLTDEDIVPEGYNISKPVLEIVCAFGKPEDDEFEKAFAKAPEEFGGTLKPIVFCASVRQVDTDKPKSKGFSEEWQVESSKPPKRVKVYFTSALAEEFRGGDADFMKSLIDGMHLIGVEALRIANSMLVLGDEQRQQMREGKLVVLNYYAELGVEERKIIKANFAKQQAAFLKVLRDYLREDREKHPDIVQILSIQSRLPGSGSAFQKPDDIGPIEGDGVKVFVTVHEWLYNSLYLTGRADEVNPKTKSICQAATGSIFANDLDHQDAGVAHSAFIPIPITIAFQTIDIEAVLKRPVRILMFGLLRESKGFEKAPEVGSLVQDPYFEHYDPEKKPIDQKWNVWVVGKIVQGYANFEQLVENVYGSTITKSGSVGLAKGWFKKLADANPLDDDVFNAKVAEVLEKCETLRTARYKDYRKYLENKKAVDALLEKLDNVRKEVQRIHDAASKTMTDLAFSKPSGKGQINPKVAKVDLSAASGLGDRLLKDVGEAAKEKAAPEVVADWERFADLESKSGAWLESYRLQQPKLAPPETNEEAYAKQALKIKVYKDVLAALDAESKKLSAPFTDLPKPVFFKINLSEEALVKTYQECKYVFKPDEKGMADNASAMISPMANGCILFTKWGGITPDEFLDKAESREREKGSERYKLDFSGRFRKAIVLSEGKDVEIAPKDVVKAIVQRERPGDKQNRETLACLKVLTEHRYLPIMIAARYVLYMKRRLDPRARLDYVRAIQKNAEWVTWV